WAARNGGGRHGREGLRVGGCGPSGRSEGRPQVSGGEIAALIAAIAFAVLVLVLAVPIVGLRRTVAAATRTLDAVASDIGPMLDKADTTIANVNTALTQVHTTLDGVNLQLARLDTITAQAQTVTANVANLSTIVSAAAANPLVKVAAFSYGVRKTVAKRRDADQEREVRDELKARRRTRRSGGTR